MSAFAVGLIGGIASGKSLASRYFNELGIEVIDSDQVARDIVKPGSPILDEIVSHFGREILTAQGELNRPLLRAKIFADPALRLWLEALMHPVIRREIDTAIDMATSPYCVVAIPLLKNRSDYPKLNLILFIDAPVALQIRWLQARDKITEEQAKHIISTQPSREARLQLADLVILNDGSPENLFEKLKTFDENIRKIKLQKLSTL